MDHFVPFVLQKMYLCLVFLMLSRLFIATLWSPAGTGLTSRLVNCVFVTFPCGILGQVWYLIVSIPDFCRLPYFIWLCTIFQVCFFLIIYNRGQND